VKKSRDNSAFPVSVGIGVAMGVALKDNAVGFAIGMVIFVMMIIANKVKKSKDL
jgi:hypothetical protein